MDFFPEVRKKDHLRSSEGGGTIDKNRMRYKLKSRGAEGERRRSEPPKLWRERLRENRASSEIFGHDLTCLHLTVAIRDAAWYLFCSFFKIV